MRESQLFESLVRRAASELEFLPDKPEENPESTIAALWCAAAGTPASAETAVLADLPALDEERQRLLMDLFDRRRSGIPLQHITGRQRFLDVDLLAGPQALIPRKETEILVRAVMGIADRLKSARPTILDVCTGAGNIACVLATHYPDARVYASDLSPQAVELAQQNARFLEISDRIEFRCGNLLDPFDQPEFYSAIDILTCNPPYISSSRIDAMNPQISDHEPRMAFDGGPFGVKILQSLIREAPRFIRPGGWLAFETGLGQGEAMEKRLGTRGYSDIQTFRDPEGNVRALTAAVPRG